MVKLKLYLTTITMSIKSTMETNKTKKDDGYKEMTMKITIKTLNNDTEDVLHEFISSHFFSFVEQSCTIHQTWLLVVMIFWNYQLN